MSVRLYYRDRVTIYKTKMFYQQVLSVITQRKNTKFPDPNMKLSITDTKFTVQVL